MEAGPVLAADAVVRTVVDGMPHVLLVRRAREPFRGQLAIPGGKVVRGEPPHLAALRELQEETGLVGHSPVLLGVYGAPDRDPRTHVVSIAYCVTVDDFSTLAAGTDATEAVWLPAMNIGLAQLAFDHLRILQDALDE
jgi:8-oxo-dGTP diphosphatase